MADDSFRKHHCFHKYPIYSWPQNKIRYEIYFENPTEIRNFSSVYFEFPQNPIIYIP